MATNRRRLDSTKMFTVYIQCYFVTIATILGTGILGLPVTLTYSGLYPFLASFLVGFLMQALLVYFITDLLQRAYAVQLEAVTECGRGEHLPLYSIIDEEEGSSDEVEINEKELIDSIPDLAGHVILPAEDAVKPPNLHMLGEYFLICGIRQFFDISTLLLFISILISYALAGSEAYAEVIGISHFYVIPVFVGVLTLAIVFALKIIQPIVSVLTFAKGTVLLGTVVVTFLLGTKIHNKISNDFSAVGDPFLMGTVALGGIFQTMPMLYEKIRPVRSQVINYRRAILLGISTCTVLNILWCWAVLDIVPQTNTCHSEQVLTNHSSSPGVFIESLRSCHLNISLQQSNLNGEISTVPLTRVIADKYPSYMWIAVLVEVFIIISTTVSFLTIGAAMHHTISGLVDSLWSQDKFAVYKAKLQAKSKKVCQWCSTKCVFGSFLSLLAFAVVFSIAMANPQGFVQILEKFASLSLNIQSGFFLFLMIQKATKKNCFGNLRIPLPLPRAIYFMQFLLPLYFGFAVGFDIYLLIKQVVNN